MLTKGYKWPRCSAKESRSASRRGSSSETNGTLIYLFLSCCSVLFQSCHDKGHGLFGGVSSYSTESEAIKLFDSVVFCSPACEESTGETIPCPLVARMESPLRMLSPAVPTARFLMRRPWRWLNKVQPVTNASPSVENSRLGHKLTRRVDSVGDNCYRSCRVRLADRSEPGHSSPTGKPGNQLVHVGRTTYLARMANDTDNPCPHARSLRPLHCRRSLRERTYR